MIDQLILEGNTFSFLIHMFLLIYDRLHILSSSVSMITHVELVISFEKLVVSSNFFVFFSFGMYGGY